MITFLSSCHWYNNLLIPIMFLSRHLTWQKKKSMPQHLQWVSDACPTLQKYAVKNPEVRRLHFIEIRELFGLTELLHTKRPCHFICKQQNGLTSFCTNLKKNKRLSSHKNSAIFIFHNHVCLVCCWGFYSCSDFLVWGFFWLRLFWGGSYVSGGFFFSTSLIHIDPCSLQKQ